MALKVYNIKTDFAAKGDGQQVTATVSISSTVNPTHLSATTNLWVLGDVGKAISVPGAGAAGGVLESSISSFTNAQNVVLNNAASTTLSGASKLIEWGTDDAAKFDSFNTTARAWQTGHPGDTFELDIPAGRYEFATQTGNSAFWSAGLKTLTVVGAGQTNTFLSDCGFVTAGGWEPGATSGLYPTNPTPGTVSSRVQTVAAGSSTVTLMNVGEATNWAAGTRGMMAGVDLAGFGSPQTPAFWEYVRITGVDNGTGIITFTPPLANGYKSTWPLYNPGGVSEYDQGGPATLFQLHPDSDIQQVFQDFTVDEPDRQLTAKGRDMTFTRITTTGGLGLIVSQQDNVTWNNVTQTASLEMDKCVGTFTSNNCTLHQMDFQTQCANVWNDNGSVIGSSSNGAAIKTVLSGTNINALLTGPHSYGVAQSLTCSNCTFGTFGYAGVVDNNATTNWTITNGVIKVPHSSGAVPWAVPGSRLFFAGQFDNEGVPFTVIDLTQDASFTYILTSLSITGWPSLPLSSGQLTIRTHPAPVATFASCIGNVDVVDLSQVGAQGKPLYSYTNRTYDQTISGAVIGAEIWGRVVFIKINVLTPYVGTQNPALFNVFAQFSNYPTILPSGAAQNYGPIIDLRAGGLRTITPAGVSGKQTNDSGLTLPNPVTWLTQSLSPFMGVNISDSPMSVSIEVQTDQGFPSVMPLGLRLHG